MSVCKYSYFLFLAPLISLHASAERRGVISLAHFPCYKFRLFGVVFLKDVLFGETLRKLRFELTFNPPGDGDYNHRFDVSIFIYSFIFFKGIALRGSDFF